MRAGYSLVELSLGILIVMGLIVGGFKVYKKLSTGTKASTAFNQTSAVISAIERAKMSNGGTYPAASSDTKLSSFSIVMNEMGGTGASKDVLDWTYKCPAGSDKTITVATTKFDSPEIADLVTRKINNNNQPWTAKDDGDSSVTFELANVVCR